MLLKTNNNNIILVLGLLRETLVLYLNLIKSHWREGKPFGGIWEKHVKQNIANKNSQFTSRMVSKTLWHEHAFERKLTKLSCGNKLHFRSYLGKRRLRLKNFSGAHQMRSNRSGWCEKSRTTKWWRIAQNRTILGWQFPLWDQSDVPEPGRQCPFTFKENQIEEALAEELKPCRSNDDKQKCWAKHLLFQASKVVKDKQVIPLLTFFEDWFTLQLIVGSN